MRWGEISVWSCGGQGSREFSMESMVNCAEIFQERSSKMKTKKHVLNLETEATNMDCWRLLETKARP